VTRGVDARIGPEATDPITDEPVTTDPDGHPQAPSATPIDNPSG
jgi:hypothetical protein